MFNYNFNKPQSFEDIKVKEYIKKYIKEVQRHFDLSNIKMRHIVFQVYKDLSPFSQIKKELRRYIKISKAMIKSKMENLTKKGN